MPRLEQDGREPQGNEWIGAANLRVTPQELKRECQRSVTQNGSIGLIEQAEPTLYAALTDENLRILG